jgi:hypothetical protein
MEVSVTNTPDDQYPTKPLDEQRIDESLHGLVTGAGVPRVPVKTHMLHDYKQLPLTENARPLCTWPLDTTEGRAKLHQVLNQSSPSLWDMCERGSYQFRVCNLAVHFSSWEPEDRKGELVEGPMFHLVGPEETYHSGADGVFLSLQQLALLEGLPPWDPPVVLRAERVPTRNRRMRLALMFIGRG